MTAKPPAGEKCRRCQGRKWIVLLVSRSTCPDCDGTGVAGGKRSEEDDEEDDDEGDTGEWPLDPRV